MDRRDLDRLVDDICNARFEYIGYENKKSSRRVGDEYEEQNELSKKNAIESAVYHWGEDMIDYKSAELGELKAKCYAYEQMIANSNFAPMLQQQKIDTKLIEERGKRTAWLSVLKTIDDLEIRYKTIYGSEIIEQYADIVSDLKDMLNQCIYETEGEDEKEQDM